MGIQVNAPTVEEAIERGLAQMGLARSQIRVTVLDEGRRGILGIGARDAVVVLESNVAPPSAAPIQMVSPPPPAVQVAVPSQVAPSPAQPAIKAAPEPDESDDQDMDGLIRSASGDEMPLEQVGETARQVLLELLNKMGIEAYVNVHVAQGDNPDQAPVSLDIEGNNVEVLVGQQGQVLNALQYITRLIVSREVERWVDLVVDVDKYKERRASSLHKLALRMAERVARTQQPVALEPMPPNERREIHLALRNHPEATTQSVGRGDDRKVTIIPRH